MPFSDSVAGLNVPLGNTGLLVPRVVFGTTSLGNIYQAVPWETKRALLEEIFRHSPAPVVLDSAGKYGAGLALELIGKGLRELGVSPEQVVITNKLGWYRIPLRGPEPTFEPGVWAGIEHDAELRISYEGILQCHEQGCELLGAGFTAQLVSVHDPDEYLAAAAQPEDRARRFADILGAYRALFELKRRGVVQAVGVGAKDWRAIQEIAAHVDLDWVMFACSLTIHSHTEELLQFIDTLRQRNVGIINSAVFNAGFLTGGEWFDYRRPDPAHEAPLFEWRRRFFAICERFGVKPAEACVQFSLAVPGVTAVALSTAKPERVKDNVALVNAQVPESFWQALKDEGMVQRSFPGH